VISSFPKWTPGKQNGKAVSVKYTVPINFQLADEGDDTTADPKKEKETKVVYFKSKPVAETFEAKPVSLVEQPSPSDTKITITGRTGPFTAGTEPLYILDGEELEPAMFKTIDPNTISSVNVLKGESATSIYGSKGANGVVVINSKGK